MHSAIGFQDVKTNLKINFEINSSQNIIPTLPSRKDFLELQKIINLLNGLEFTLLLYWKSFAFILSTETVKWSISAFPKVANMVYKETGFQESNNKQLP